MDMCGYLSNTKQTWLESYLFTIGLSNTYKLKCKNADAAKEWLYVSLATAYELTAEVEWVEIQFKTAIGSYLKYHLM